MPAPVRPVPRPLPRPPAKKISLPEYKLQLPRHGWLPPIKYVQVMTHSRCNADCFAPETRVITPAGDKEIGELVGKSSLLVPGLNNGTYGNHGAWLEAPVRSFGTQPLRHVVLRRGQQQKIIRTTPGHRWFVQRYTRHTDGSCAQRYVATTRQLKPGDPLTSCYRAPVGVSAYPIRLSPAGVAQGFVFGDGGCGAGDRRPATVRFYTERKEQALRPYFVAFHREQVAVNGGKLVQEARDLPRYWKEPPPLDESKSFLLGWLAGYFAADGCVPERGYRAHISSSLAENIELVRAVCYQLGVGVSPVAVKRRGPNSFKPGANEYSASFDMVDLPLTFWLQEHHRARAEANLARNPTSMRESPWVVSEVLDRGEREEVFCATVPEAECFTLADNLLTKNCVFCPYSESAHHADPGTMSAELWQHVLLNLAPFRDGINQGKFCPYLMQEPLIDKTIFDKIDDIYEIFPKTCVEISTNGAALTDKTIDNLFTAFQGKRHDLWVSHHGINAETLQEIMKIDYDKATANLISLLKKSDGKFNIKIRGAGESSCVSKVYFTHQQYVAYWAEMFTKHNINTKNVSVDSFRFHDRAGTLHRADRGANTLNKGKIRDIGPGHQPFWCGRIDEWVHIDYKGDLVLCCMDYHREVQLPNLKDIWLVEYFHSPAYEELVKKVSGRCQPEDGFICTRCTSPGG